MRRGSNDADAKELEAMARAKLKAEEKEKQKAEQEARKLEEDRAADMKRPAWGSRGVHSLLDDDYADEEELSPVVPRKNPDANSQPMAYPASEEKVSKGKRAGATPIIESAWALPGSVNTKSLSAKDVIGRAAHQAGSEQAATAQQTGEEEATAKGQGGGAVEFALKLLGEQLVAERQRSVAAEQRAERLEAQLAQVTRELLDFQAKALLRLEN